MTQLKVDTITDAAGTAAPDLEDGLTINGAALSTVNTAEYSSGATEPTDPKDGAIWWDTANEKVMIRVNDAWYEVVLGASASSDWTVDLSNVTYDSVSFSVASQDSGPLGIAFNTDGTKMYIVGNATDSVYQYSLSTGFDLSTASYDSVSFSVSSQDDKPFDLAFNTDGTKMYMVGNTNDRVYQYSLSTGFDLSTASYDSVSFSVSSQESTPSNLTFNTDGTKMYVIGEGSDSVFQYSLSTGFDLSTASYDSVSFSVSSQETSPSNLAFNSDGTKMYVIGEANDRVYQYSLSTGFDVSTASYESGSFSISSQEGNPFGIAFNSDGTKMYIVGYATDSVYQYSTGL